MQRVWRLAVTLAWFLPACTSADPDDASADLPNGSATLSIPLAVDDLTRVEVTVTGSGIDNPIVAALSIQAETATGVVGKIPAGADRTFRVDAYRDTDLVCTGSGMADIVSGEVATVIVVLQCNPDAEDVGAAEVNGTFNFPPRIESASADAAAILVSGTVNLSVAAADPNSGDELVFAWSSDDGTFSDPTNASTAWTAPDTTGSETLTIVVTDNHGASTSLDVSIDVILCTGALGPQSANCAGTNGDSVSVECSDLTVGRSYCLDLTSGDYGNESMAMSGANTAVVPLSDPWPQCFAAGTSTLDLVVQDDGDCSDNHLVEYELLTHACAGDLGPGADSCEGTGGDNEQQQCGGLAVGRRYTFNLLDGAYGNESIKLSGAHADVIPLTGPWPIAFTAGEDVLTVVVLDAGSCGDNHLVEYEVLPAP